MKITDAKSILGDFQAAYDFSEQSVVVEVNRDERKKNFYMMSFFSFPSVLFVIMITFL